MIEIESVHFRWWWSDLFWIIKIPQLILATVIFPLNYLGSVALALISNIQNFTTICVNHVIFLPFFLINSKSLSWIIAFLSKEKSSPVCIILNCQILIVLLAFNKPIGTFLNQSKRLILSSISVPKNGGTFERSILSNI